jgi:alkylation response protein AidB-like acyl-CoA dehydrogenase
MPAGLAGWAWGELRLQNARLRPCDVLGRPGEGMTLLREHFAHYRPLVAATALGTAAAVHDHVAAHLCTRRSSGVITDLRDNALITLGRSYAQINAALLAALTAQRLSESGDMQAGMWGCAVKAYGCDVAHAAASELTLLTGAAGFTAGSSLAKALGDLAALQYADGIHDSLYRAVGRALTNADPGSPRSDSAAQDITQIARLPPSSDKTVPLISASRHAAIRRPTSGVTRPATWAGRTNANPASSLSGRVIASISAGGSMPPS